MRGSVEKLGPGVDIRADGNYIIWWPAHGGEVLNAGTIADMPEWLHLQIMQAGSILHDAAAPLAPEELAQPYPLAAVEVLIGMGNPAEATRDDYKNVMLAVQGCIRGSLAADRMDDSEADMTRDAAADWAARWDHPNASDFETERRKWDDDWSKRTNDIAGWRQLLGAARRLGLDTASWEAEAAAREFGALPPEPEAAPEPEATDDQRAALISILDVHSWIRLDIPEPDRLLGDLLTTTSRMFLVGRTGLGKTLLGLGIAAGVASGTGFLHWPAGRPARVVYIDGEMPAELIKPRAADALRRLGGAAVPAGNLLIFGRDIETTARRAFPSLPPFAPLNTAEGRHFIFALVKAIGGVDLVIFDNVMSLMSGNQKDEVPWSETLPLVQALTDRRIGQLWLDHTGHNSDRQYGSSTKAWRFDAVGVMKPIDGETDPHATVFTLSFEHPGKARRRTPDNWQQFAPQKVRLTADGWANEPVAKDAAKAEQHSLKPATRKQHDALLALLDRTARAGTTRDEWYAECVQIGLNTEVPADASGRVRSDMMASFRTRISELVTAGWIQVNGEAVLNLKTGAAI
jgi:hypothetical protein